MNSFRWNNLSLKYERCTPSGWYHIGIRKFKFRRLRLNSFLVRISIITPLILEILRRIMFSTSNTKIDEFVFLLFMLKTINDKRSQSCPSDVTKIWPSPSRTPPLPCQRNMMWPCNLNQYGVKQQKEIFQIPRSTFFFQLINIGLMSLYLWGFFFEQYKTNINHNLS